MTNTGSQPTRTEAEAEAQRRRFKTTAALHHWQGFVAQLGKILRCPGMDVDVLKAVRKLKRDNRGLRKQLRSHNDSEAEEKARLERAREQFEKWGNAKGAHIELSWSGEHYENRLVESAWQGWQARSDFTLSEMEAANKRIAELEAKLKYCNAHHMEAGD